MHEKVWNSFCTRLDELPKFNLTKSTKDLAGPEYGEFTLVCRPLFTNTARDVQLVRYSLKVTTRIDRFRRIDDCIVFNTVTVLARML